jgi:FkbM family methyltransferase
MRLGIKNIALIEPCAKAFNILQNKYGAHHHIKLFNYACTYASGEATMYTETANKGQSNSLLKPKEHLTHYPDIQFTGNEIVKTIRLDALQLNGSYNMLNIDVQGAEAHVLTGAPQTLNHIDYVYTEVNKPGANLYESACDINDLDRILCDYDKVAVQFTAQGWGDALYIRKTKLQLND